MATQEYGGTVVRFQTNADGLTPPSARRQKETGVRPAFALEAFGDLDDDVKQSIARIKASPFIPNKSSVRGFVYDVRTGKLNEVGAAVAV